MQMANSAVLQNEAICIPGQAPATATALALAWALALAMALALVPGSISIFISIFLSAPVALPHMDHVHLDEKC